MLRFFTKPDKRLFTEPVQSDTRPLDNEARLAQYHARKERQEGTDSSRLRQAARRLARRLR